MTRAARTPSHSASHPSPRRRAAHLDAADTVYDGMVRLQEYAREHWQAIALAAGAAVLAGGLAIGTRAYGTRRRATAAAALYAATTVESETNRRDALRRVAEEYPSTGGGVHAALLAAQLAFDAGDYAEARELYELIAGDEAGGPFAPAALIGIGATWEAEGGLAAAADAYRRALDNYPIDAYTRPQALLALARVAEAEGDTETALARYRDIVGGHPGTVWEREAQARLQELAPEAAPEPAAPPAPEPAPVP